MKSAAAVLALLLTPSMAQAAEFTGHAERVHDRDTFWVCDANACTKIRLCGIEAPEDGDPGDEAATEALKAFLNGEVRCVQVGGGTPCDGRSKPTNGDRVVAQCFANGVDVAEPMTTNGYACDWVRYWSLPVLAAQEISTPQWR